MATNTHITSDKISHAATGLLSATRKMHWSDRSYSPIEAARAASQYLTFDPGFYLRQCELAGLSVGTDGKLIHMRTTGDPLALSEKERFLQLWMRLGSGGKLLRTSLKRRGMFDDGLAGQD